MPKPLSPEQLETLHTNGIIVPGYEASEAVIPAGLVQRALGATGLPNSVEVNRLGDSITSDTVTNPEIFTSESFRNKLLSAYNTTSQIMDLVGEAIPDLQASEFQANLAEMSETFSLYETLGLEPDLVLTPAGRPLEFWIDVFAKAQASPLNPTQAGSDKKVIRNGGLFVNDVVENAWKSLTKRDPQDLGNDWKLEVISGLTEPKITNVTSYGYKDEDNLISSNALNLLLRKLDLPLVIDRNKVTIPHKPTPPLIQPNIHPNIDTYAMNQLTRIIQGKDPVDINTCSWLRGELPDGAMPVGYWFPFYGQIYLLWGGAELLDHMGVRPAGSAHNA